MNTSARKLTGFKFRYVNLVITRLRQGDMIIKNPLNSSTSLSQNFKTYQPNNSIYFIKILTMEEKINMTDESLKHPSVFDKIEKDEKQKQNQQKNKSAQKQEDYNLDFSKVGDELNSYQQQSISSRASKMPQPAVNKILEEVKSKVGYKSREQAAGAIGILCQLGGAAKNCNGELSTDIFGREFKLQTLRTILKRNKKKDNIRKFARSLDKYIHRVCWKLGIPGNLYKRISSHNPEKVENFSISNKAYMSDFQLENPEIPTHIKRLIIESRTYNNKKK